MSGINKMTEWLKSEIEQIASVDLTTAKWEKEVAHTLTMTTLGKCLGHARALADEEAERAADTDAGAITCRPGDWDEFKAWKMAGKPTAKCEPKPEEDGIREEMERYLNGCEKRLNGYVYALPSDILKIVDSHSRPTAEQENKPDNFREAKP
jgi:hypothetical protein